jgi:hypothetical protein
VAARGVDRFSSVVDDRAVVIIAAVVLAQIRGIIKTLPAEEQSRMGSGQAGRKESKQK